MFAQSMPWRLGSAAMAEPEDLEAQRRGYWLRRARNNAGVTLADAAVTAGLSAGSGSSVSLWESGARPIKVQQMKRLAARYGVPASLFLNPERTDDERLAEAIADAAALERADSASEAEARRRAGDEPAGPPGRRSA